MIMKKQIINWGMMLAVAFTLTNCTTEIENPSQEQETVGYPFEITLSDAEAKTVNAGLTTKWASGDEINLFHAIGETTDYKNNNAFTLKSADEGKFEGNLVEALNLEEEYDWFAFYPYKSYITTPAEQEAGWTYIGGRSDVAQTQSGVSNLNHIAGENYPLSGKAVAVPGSSQPEIVMSHAFALLQVNVTNGLEEELDVTSVSFAAETSLVGQFYPCITGDVVTYTDGQYVANEAKLAVSDAKIAAGETASFYLAVKPFAAEIDSELKIIVNDDCAKILKMTKVVTFAAGKIKPLNFTYDKVADPETEGVKATISFASTTQRTSYSTSAQVWENDGVTLTNNKASSQTNVGDYSNPARFYKGSDIVIEAPGNITQIVFNCNTATYATSLKNSIGNNATVDNKTVTVTVDGATSVTYALTDGQVRMDNLTLTYEVADPTVPLITAGNVTDISARGIESAELTYEIANLEYSDLTVTCDGTIVTSASKGVDGVINYTVSANSTTSEREGLITISNGTLAKEVKVSQVAPVFTVARNAVELAATKDSKTTVTVTSDFDWELSYVGTGYTVTPNDYTWAEDGKSTITIQATADRTEEGVADLGTITITNSETNQKLTISVTQATSFEPEPDPDQPGDGGETGGEEKTITLTLNKETTGNSATSYVQTAYTFTYADVTYSVNNWNPKTLQIRGNQTTQSNLQSGKNFMLRNTTAIPGIIKSITLSYTAGSVVASKTYATVSASAISSQTTAGSTAGTAATDAVTWTFADGGSYFAIGMVKGGTSGTTNAGTITIVYEAN